MGSKEEWVPWYRRRDYDGNLTEAEKRHLDGFRQGGRHPAPAHEDLPTEVQSYLCELELLVYDSKQDSAVTRMLFWCAIGALLVVLAYFEQTWNSPIWGYVVGIAFIGFSWFRYRREWKKNAGELWIKSKGRGIPFSRIDEKLQEYWELNEIQRMRVISHPNDEDDCFN